MPTTILDMIRTGAEIAFYLFILVFILHAAMLAYHWFTYGENRKISTLALGIYLVGGGVLFLILGVSLTMI